MREFRSYGSVRGAPSNGRPYRKTGANDRYVETRPSARVACRSSATAAFGKVDYQAAHPSNRSVFAH